MRIEAPSSPEMNFARNRILTFLHQAYSAGSNWNHLGTHKVLLGTKIIKFIFWICQSSLDNRGISLLMFSVLHKNMWVLISTLPRYFHRKIKKKNIGTFRSYLDLGLFQAFFFFSNFFTFIYNKSKLTKIDRLVFIFTTCIIKYKVRKKFCS